MFYEELTEPRTFQEKINALRTYSNRSTISRKQMNIIIQELIDKIDGLRQPGEHDGLDAEAIGYNRALNDVLSIIGENREWRT